MAPIRILLADDHPMFRYGLRAVFDSSPSTELVGEARDGDEAVAMAGELRPDVVLMDVTMPGHQHRDRRPAAPEPEDRPQLRLHGAGEAQREHTSGGHRPGPSGRARATVRLTRGLQWRQRHDPYAVRRRHQRPRRTMASPVKVSRGPG
jgi:hypothetical protein